MIEKWNKEKNLDEIMKIWLYTNIEAHNFIDEDYWYNNFETVKELLPKSDIFLYIKEGEILGFIGIMEKNYIAGLFIKKEFQKLGIGKKLVEHCKDIYEKLELDVYEKNKNAVLFYERNEFNIEEKSIEENDEMQYRMVWKRE